MKTEQLAVALICLVSGSICGSEMPLGERALSGEEQARLEYIKCNAERKRLIADIGRSDPLIIQKLDDRTSAECRTLEAIRIRQRNFRLIRDAGAGTARHVSGLTFSRSRIRLR